MSDPMFESMFVIETIITILLKGIGILALARYVVLGQNKKNHETINN